MEHHGLLKLGLGHTEIQNKKVGFLKETQTLKRNRDKKIKK
jgi:hypothetical protein